MCVLHCSEGKRGVSIAGLLPVESVHLAHSRWHPLRQRHWTKLNCWTHDCWLFGGTVEVVTTLAHFRYLPQTKLASLDTPASSLSVSTISSDISLACSKRGLLLSRLILHQHAQRLSNAELEITSSLCNTTQCFETHSDI